MEDVGVEILESHLLGEECSRLKVAGRVLYVVDRLVGLRFLLATGTHYMPSSPTCEELWARLLLLDWTYMDDRRVPEDGSNGIVVVRRLAWCIIHASA